MPSRNIKDAAPELQAAWTKLVEMYEKDWLGYTLHLTCTHRTPEEQFELFKQGRHNYGTVNSPDWQKIDYPDSTPTTERDSVVTYADGDQFLSAHNYYPARAFDVVVVNKETKAVTWQDVYYCTLGEYATKLGIVWGGSWSKLKDLPHFEIRGFKTYKLPNE
jgi:peptidoglycan LD-endopeptidase CwlK